MNRNKIEKLVSILKALLDGKEIEFYSSTLNKWMTSGMNSIATLTSNIDNYRIKPEPKYRPFANAEECWAEMLKHQPFGWLKSPNGEVNSLIIFIDNEGLIIGDRNNGVMGFVTATDLFKIKFADGTPFGVKVEE